MSEPQTHAGPGRGHKGSISNEKKTNRSECGSFSKCTQELLRAINRAPDSARKLYEQDKLSRVSWAS